MKKITKKATGLKNVLKVDEAITAEVRTHLDAIVRQSVEETLNGMLEAEADQLCQAKRYQRTPDRVDTRAGSYERSSRNGLIIAEKTEKTNKPRMKTLIVLHWVAPHFRNTTTPGHSAHSQIRYLPRCLSIKKDKE